MNNFKHIGDIDPRPLAAACAFYGAHFKDVTWRQDAPESAHRDTETIFLRSPAKLTKESIFNELESIDLSLYRQCGAFRFPCEMLGRAFGLPLGRVMIVKLFTHGRVTPHRDEGPYADATERFHVVIESNESCVMHCGGQLLKMPVGSVWWFDKHREHFFVNDGTTDRLHLIIDLHAR